MDKKSFKSVPIRDLVEAIYVYSIDFHFHKYSYSLCISQLFNFSQKSFGIPNLCWRNCSKFLLGMKDDCVIRAEDSAGHACGQAQGLSPRAEMNVRNQ